MSSSRALNDVTLKPSSLRRRNVTPVVLLEDIPVPELGLVGTSSRPQLSRREPLRVTSPRSAQRCHARRPPLRRRVESASLEDDADTVPERFTGAWSRRLRGPPLRRRYAFLNVHDVSLETSRTAVTAPLVLILSTSQPCQ